MMIFTGIFFGNLFSKVVNVIVLLSYLAPVGSETPKELNLPSGALGKDVAVKCTDRFTAPNFDVDQKHVHFDFFPKVPDIDLETISAQFAKQKWSEERYSNTSH